MAQNDRRTSVPASIALSIALGFALIGAAPSSAVPPASQDVNPLDPPIPRVILLTGRVTSLHKAVAHANVRILRAGTVVANTLSGADGTYRFSDAAPDSGVPATIAAGTYSLEAQYRTSIHPAGTVALRAGRTQRRDIELPLLALLGGAAPPRPRTTFFATDRVANPGGTTVDNAFGNDRPIQPCSGPSACMHLAFARVAAVGPPSLQALTVTPDMTAFVAAMRAEYPTADTAIIFVHGFNNDFHDPAVLTASVVAALAPSAVPIDYSWPSKHVTARYIDDESSNQWATDHFRDFLVALLSAPNAPKTVHIMAHSMGNRVAVSVLQYLHNAKPALTGHIGQAVFAAPDVDAATFWEAVPEMATVAQGVTVYSSAHDEALQLSRQLHGHCRAGLTGCNDTVALPPNANAIDASFFHCDILGHGYWAASATIVADITQTMKDGVMAGATLRPNLQNLGSNKYRFASAGAGGSGCAAEPRN